MWDAKGCGAVRDLPDQRAPRYVPPRALARALPAKVDLRSGLCEPYNQGGLGSCTANAIAGALQFLERKEGARDPVMPSRLFIYYNERVIEGSTGSDSGAQTRDGIKTVVKQGYCPESEWPYAVERFAQALPAAAKLLAHNGQLALLIGSSKLELTQRSLTEYMWQPPLAVPLSATHVLLVGIRQ